MKIIHSLWLRNIKKNKIQFFSIMSIIFISVAFLIGLLSSSFIIKNSILDYYEESKLPDIKVTSYKGFHKEDIENITKIKGVKDISLHKEEDLWLENSQEGRVEGKVIYFHNFIKEDFDLILGSLPKDEDEGLLVIGNTYINELKIGDVVKLKKENKNEYTNIRIVGLVRSPLLLSTVGEPTTVGSGLYNNIVFAKNKEDRGFDTLNIYIDKDSNTIYDEAYDRILTDIDKEIEQIDKDRIESISPIDLLKDPTSFLKWNRKKSTDITGVSRFKADIEKVGAIAKVFPFFFFLVAFLVVMTSMTKIIEDNRSEVGILRSIGYGKRTIYLFYGSYGLVISLISSILAVPFGFEIFPKVISKAYSITYNLPEIKIKYLSSIYLPIIMLSIIIVVVTVLKVTKNILKEKPSELFLYKETKNKGSNNILLEKISFLWDKLSFRTKVNLRNIFLYKKRMFMTIVGISGCFALVLTSFGLKDSIANIVEKQYDNIYMHDILATISQEDNSLDKAQDFEKVVQLTDSEVFVVGDKNNDEPMVKVYLSIFDSPKELDGILSASDMDDNKVELEDNGILVSQKLAEIYNINKGQHIEVKIKNHLYSFKVSGIFKNYVGHKLVTTREYYKKITDLDPGKNIALIKLKDDSKKDINEILEELIKNNKVLHTISTESIKDSFSDSMNNLNYVILVMSISAGILSVVILYNLTHINIMERMKELATLKVLGYMPRELRRYIFREINWLSIFGIVIGVPLGILLHRFVILKVEIGGAMLDRSVEISSYLLSLVIIVAFIFFSNLLLKKKIDKIDVIQAMKSKD